MDLIIGHFSLDQYDEVIREAQRSCRAPIATGTSPVTGCPFTGFFIVATADASPLGGPLREGIIRRLPRIVGSNGPAPGWQTSIQDWVDSQGATP